MPIRPTFWNIPHWAEIALYISSALAVAVLIGKLYLRFLIWRKGQTRPTFDRLPQRIGRLLRYGLVQSRTNREGYAGSMHTSMFAGFLILFVGTALATIDWDITRLIWEFRILKGPFYLAYELVLDLFSLLLLLGLALSALRRRSRPAKLTSSSQFGYMLGTLWFLLVTGFLIEGLRLAVEPPAWAWWSPVGNLIGIALRATGLGEPILRGAHVTLWMAHSLVVLGFIVSLVETPFRHLLASPTNVFFSSFKAPGALAPLDLEDPTIERFGAGQLPDLGWTQIMNGDACTECGRCQVACPANMAGTPLNPKQIVLDIRAAIDDYGGRMLANGNNGDFSLIDPDRTSEEALWACTTCRACVYECPVLIEHVDSIVDMRRHLVLMESNMPSMLATAMTQAERAGNPWGNPAGSRMDWAEGLDVPLMADKKKADVLYWVGCAGAYDPASQKTTRAVVKILQAAGVDFAMLGEEERCNCEWARRAGNEYLFQMATQENVGTFDKYEFDVLLTHCPHCFNTFKNEYPQFNGDYHVMHHSTYVANLIAEGKIKPSVTIQQTITYHDSCYLGRYNDQYDSPRDVLQSVPGVQLVEMERSRQKGLCCGGGGAQVWFEKEQEIPVEEIRLEEAMELKPNTIGTACPFCTIMISSAAQTKGITDQVATRDVAEIIADAL
jgi:Fe-S oxidoreductase